MDQPESASSEEEQREVRGFESSLTGMITGVLKEQFNEENQITEVFELVHQEAKPARGCDSKWQKRAPEGSSKLANSFWKQ